MFIIIVISGNFLFCTLLGSFIKSFQKRKREKVKLLPYHDEEK